MDPSIVKLLEDDEDESMHSGADLEAFTAALNRDIRRDESDVSPLSDVIVSSGTIQDSNQFAGRKQAPNQEENQMKSSVEQTEQNSVQMGHEKQQSGFSNLHQEGSSQQEPQNSHIKQEQQHCKQEKEKGNKEVVETCNKQNHASSSQENAAKESKNQKHHPRNDSCNQQPQSSDQANNPMRKMKLNSISFYALIPVLRPFLDKDRYVQLNDVFSKLKSNEISREDFLRVIRNTVGDQMLRQAVHKVMQDQALAARNPQTSQSQHQFQVQTFPHHLPARSSRLPENQTFSEVRSASSVQHQRLLSSQSETTASTVQIQSNAGFGGSENIGRSSNISETSSVRQVMPTTRVSSVIMTSVKQEREGSLQVTNKQQIHSQQLHASFPMHGGTVGSYASHQFPRPIGGPPSSVKTQTQDSQRQQSLPPGMLSSQSGAARPVNLLSMPKILPGSSLSKRLSQPASHENQLVSQQSSNEDRMGSSSSSMAYVKKEVVEQSAEAQNGIQISLPQNSSAMMSDQVKSSFLKDQQIENQPSRMVLYTSTSILAASHVTCPNVYSPEETVQMHSQKHSNSITSPTVAGANSQTPVKKPSVGQKKPLEAQGIPPLSSKKQKVSGAFQDQSIEQLNDVAAVSGVNLREEEEQLLTAPKEESRASEAMRRAVQEEEEKLIVQRHPLRKKIAEIMSRCSIKNASTDVDRCLSMCLEERLRGLISNLIRLSKQRVDSEKPRHRIVFTSDVRQEVLSLNRKAKEELDRKHAEEAEKLRKVNEGEGNTGVGGEKDKDEARSKIPKGNKDEDDKMRATAANVAARAAVGGDDMLSKWQLMAEQARQKREGGVLEGSSAPEAGKDAIRKKNSGNNSRDNHGDKKGGSADSSGVMRKFGSVATMPRMRANHNIFAKDVIGVLQREPQMSKSTLLYRLFERMSADPVVETRHGHDRVINLPIQNNNTAVLLHWKQDMDMIGYL